MSDILRVAVVGAGGIAWHHLSVIRESPEIAAVAVCDINAEAAAAKAEEFALGAHYTDLKAMLRDAEFDAAIIATPNFLHAPQTLACLKAGKHVFCEKPPAMTVKDAQKMADAAEKAGRKLMINFSYRFGAMSRALKAQVDAGVVGDIYFGRSVWHRRRGFPGFGGWFGQKDKSGGGPLIDLGVHRLDLALWLMGYPEPVSVSGETFDPIARRMVEERGAKFDVEDCACGLVRFSNGAALVLEASWALNIRERDHMVTSLYGTKGGLVQRNTGGGYDFEAEIYTEEQGSQYTKVLDDTQTAAPGPLQEFARAVLEDREVPATAEQGVKVMKILEGIYRSASTGREVRYAPQKETAK